MKILNKNWHLLTAFDIPTKINSSILLIAVFISFLGIAYLPIYALLFASVLAHEYGHALVGRYFGIRCEVIYLHVFGGAAMMHPSKSLKEEWIVAAAGPAVSIALAAISLSLYHITGLYIFSLLYVLNAMIGVFNLVPAYPMDGGRIFKALAEYTLGRKRGTFVALWLARIIAVLAIVFGLMYGQFMLAIIAVFIILLGNAEQYTINNR